MHPARHHAGSCRTGERFPFIDLAESFLRAGVIVPPEYDVHWAEGGPLDAPEYIARGGAEAFQFHADSDVVVFFHERREAL